MCVFWKPNEGRVLRKREPFTAVNAPDAKMSTVFRVGYKLRKERSFIVFTAIFQTPIISTHYTFKEILECEQGMKLETQARLCKKWQSSSFSKQRHFCFEPQPRDDGKLNLSHFQALACTPELCQMLKLWERVPDHHTYCPCE